MSEYKYQRFVRTVEINGRMTYVLADYQYWRIHEEELQEWLDDNVAMGRDAHQGMTISFANEQEEMLFILKWG